MCMYKNGRPHESLNNVPPTQFLLKDGKLYPHPTGQQEFPTFQHKKNHQHSKKETNKTKQKTILLDVAKNGVS
jgi:hypothetical protein